MASTLQKTKYRTRLINLLSFLKRHAELVSASPKRYEILGKPSEQVRAAGQARNDADM